MATESAAADLVQTETTELLGDDRPYPRSWVNVVVDGIIRLPGPSWVAFLVITVALALLTLPQVWMAGLAPVGTIEPTQVFWGAAMGIVLWLYHYLDGVARTAVDAFRPATTMSEAAFSRLRYELTVVPARPAAFIIVLIAVLTPVYYIADPVGSDVVGYSPTALVFRYISEVVFGGLVFVLVYHSLRQLRAVSRAYAQATRIDLFHPRPLYGFAGLTARTGIAVLLVIIVPSLMTPTLFTSDSVWLWASYVGLGAAAAAAVFVLPLRGVHGRLVVEKQRLQFAAEDRLKAILAELARDVDAVDLSRADAVNKTLGSLIQQREVLARLPTWPWSPGTLRGFVSIILLPIALFLAQRILLEILAIGG